MPNERDILGAMQLANIDPTQEPVKTATPVAPTVTPQEPTAPVAAPVPQATPTVSLTAEQFAALLETTVSKIVEKIPTVSAPATFQPSQPTIPDEDDILTDLEAVTFAMLGAGWLTRSYMRNGQVVVSPYGLITFSPTIEEIITNAKGQQDVLRISTYYCRSVKELAYLRNHPEYGLTFREATGKNIEQMVADPNRLNTQMVAPYVAQVNGMSELAKRQMAMDIGLDLKDPNLNLDYALALHLVKQTQEALESMQARKIESLTLTRNK